METDFINFLLNEEEHFPGDMSTLEKIQHENFDNFEKAYAEAVKNNHFLITASSLYQFCMGFLEINKKWRIKWHVCRDLLGIREKNRKRKVKDD